MQINPCTAYVAAGYSGGDLPGSVIPFHYMVESFGTLEPNAPRGALPRDEGEVDEGDLAVTLGPDTTPPTLRVNPGSTNVSPGHVPLIDVTGTEDSNASTWQTGIQALRVFWPNGFEEDYSPVNSFGNQLGGPQPCDGKAWTATSDFPRHYESPVWSVPADAQPGQTYAVIVEADDWAGNEARQTITYTVFDNLWSGTWHVVGTDTGWGEHGVLVPETFDATFQFMVGTDGRIRGTGRATDSEPPGFAGSCTVTESPDHFETGVGIGGELVNGNFELSIEPNFRAVTGTDTCPQFG